VNGIHEVRGSIPLISTRKKQRLLLLSFSGGHIRCGPALHRMKKRNPHKMMSLNERALACVTGGSGSLASQPTDWPIGSDPQQQQPTKR